MNKDCFVYEDGVVHINYPALLVARGPSPLVDITRCHADGLHVELAFRPCLEESKASRDDVVHIYAVEPQVEICQLVASVWRQDRQASFDLPDLSEETGAAKHKSTLRAPQELVSYYLYAIVGSCASREQSLSKAANTFEIEKMKVSKFS